MSRDRWILRGGSSDYEFSLGGWDGPSPDAFFAASNLEDWLRDYWAEQILREIYVALGGRTPLNLTSFGQAAYYHAEIERRLKRALDSGRLQVTRRSLDCIGVLTFEPQEAVERAAEPMRESLDLHLRVETISGDPVEDEAGFVLVMPDGSRQDARLSGGEFRKPSVDRGSHQACFKYLHDARWVPTSICTGEEVALRVATPGWSDGDEVVFKVYDPSQPPDSEPLAVIEAKVDGGEAKAMWRHVQELGAAAHGQYLFEAEISGKWIASPVLRVDPRPVSDVRGVKERLLQLGYDCGAAGPEETPEYEKALEAFQKDLSFSQLTGRADPQTQAALTEMVG